MAISLIVLWGSLIEFKAYVGVLTLGSLGIVTFIETIRGNYSFLKITLPIFLLSILVFLPNNSTSGSLFVIAPFWLINSMIDFPDRLNWMRLSLTRMSGFETGNWSKIIGAESLGLFLFLVGNLGMRIVCIVSLKNIYLLPLLIFLSVYFY